MKLTSMQQRLVAIGVMVVAVIAIAGLLILPKFSQLSQIQADKLAAEQQVAASETLLNQLEQAKGAAAETQAELLRLSNEFPESPDLPSLIIELQDVANDAGVTFNRITPSEPVAASTGSYQLIPIKVSLVGEWSDVLDYLRRVNRMTRSVRVSDITLVPVASTGTTTTVTGSPKLTAELDMNAYSMSSGGATSTVPPAGPVQ